jgi:hypothetical protein
MDAILKLNDHYSAALKALDTHPGFTMVGFNSFADFFKRLITLAITVLHLPERALGSPTDVTDGLSIPAQALRVLWVEFWTADDLTNFRHLCAITADENLSALCSQLVHVPLPLQLSTTLTEHKLWAGARSDYHAFASSLSGVTTGPPTTPVALESTFASEAGPPDSPPVRWLAAEVGTSHQAASYDGY